MTECTTDGITFSSQGRRQVTADFCGGDISSDAGVMLLREAERGLRLIERLSDAINDPRDPARITHEQSTLLKQRVLAIALGYKDLMQFETPACAARTSCHAIRMLLIRRARYRS